MLSGGAINQVYLLFFVFEIWEFVKNLSCVMLFRVTYRLGQMILGYYAVIYDYRLLLRLEKDLVQRFMRVLCVIETIM